MKLKSRFYRQFCLLASTLVVAQITFADSKKTKSVEDELKPVQGDEQTSEVHALKTELLVAKTETEAMKQLDRLLAKYKGTGMEPGLWLRKAELYIRQSKTERFFEISRDSETVVKLAPQKVKKASSQKYLKQAVETYEMMSRRFPHFNELDVVLFNNAFTRQQLNQDRYAENLYRELMSRFPDSGLVPDSHLALGEMLFDRKAFQLALVEFEAIKKYPESRVYPYGIYKAAWAKYNLKDTESGLKDLEAVVVFGKRVEAEGLDAKLDLRNEALTDMILFYEDVGHAKDAFSYFAKQAGEADLGKLMLKLSALYVRHGKHQEHEQVLNDYIRHLPESPEIPLAYKSLIDNYELIRNRAAAMSGITTLDEVCGDRSSWTKANVNDTKSPNLCIETLTKISLVYANKWHRMWKKNPTYPEFADVAESAYGIYLKYEPTGETSWENRFAYAELKFQRNKFKEASENYAIVAKEAKDSKLYHDAGYGSIVSLEKAVGDKWADADEKLFRQLSDVYLTRNKEGKYVTDIRFKRAFIAYEKGRYDEAAPDFKDLGWNKRDTVFGEKSQNLYLDILNIKKQFAQLREYTLKLLGTKLSETREKQIRKIYEEASFSEAQKLQESGDFLEAADGFEKFALANRQSVLADKAWWNAISIYSNEGYVIKATDMSHQMIKFFPQSEHTKDALLKAAQGFESMLELKKAADVLIDLAERDGGQAVKWKSLAADFYALSGSRDEAVKIYRLMTKSKDLSVSQGAYSKLMLLDDGSSKKASDMKLMSEVALSGLQPQASIAQSKIAEKTFSEGNMNEAFRSASKVLEMNKNGASKSAMAHARTIQAKILEKEFVAQSVKSRGDRLAIVLQIKTEKLDKVTQAYQDVIRYGDAKTSVNALRGMAYCYGQYVDALRGLELVGDYKKEEMEALKKELENLSLPMEDKRVDVLQEALKQAKRLAIHDGTIAEIQNEINRLNMKRTVSNTVQIKLPDILLPKFNATSSIPGGTTL